MYKEIYEQFDALRQCIAGRVDREMGTGRLGGMGLDHAALVQAPTSDYSVVEQRLTPLKSARC